MWVNYGPEKLDISITFIRNKCAKNLLGVKMRQEISYGKPMLRHPITYQPFVCALLSSTGIAFKNCA